MERMPPRLLMLYFGLLGIGVLFAGLVALYVYTRARRTAAPATSLEARHP